MGVTPFPLYKSINYNYINSCLENIFVVRLQSQFHKLFHENHLRNNFLWTMVVTGKFDFGTGTGRKAFFDFFFVSA